MSAATVKVYVDGSLIFTTTFESTSYTTRRIKLPARFGRFVEIEFTWTGAEEFGVLPPLILNPDEPEV